jgi:lipopolysaccharide export LptBFGC system permease protein LptF
MERLVDPILTDIRVEAAKAGRWTNLWIHLAGVAALFKALATYGWSQFWMFREWPDDDRRVLVRTLAYSVAATAAAILLLTAPVLMRWRALGWDRFPPHLLLLQVLGVVAQAVSFALPIGLFVGLIYGFRAKIVTLRPRAAVMIAVMLCSIGSFVVVTSGLGPDSLGGLRSRIAYFQQSGLDVSRLAFAYHARWALAASPIVLSAWALLLIGRLAARSRVLLGIVTVASFFAYTALIGSGRVAVFSKALPPIVGAWLPNLVFVAAMILLARRTSHEHEPTRTTNGAPAS